MFLYTFSKKCHSTLLSTSTLTFNFIRKKKLQNTTDKKTHIMKIKNFFQKTKQKNIKKKLIKN